MLGLLFWCVALRPFCLGRSLGCFAGVFLLFGERDWWWWWCVERLLFSTRVAALSAYCFAFSLFPVPFPFSFLASSRPTIPAAVSLYARYPTLSSGSSTRIGHAFSSPAHTARRRFRLPSPGLLDKLPTMAYRGWSRRRCGGGAPCGLRQFWHDAARGAPLSDPIPSSSYSRLSHRKPQTALLRYADAVGARAGQYRPRRYTPAASLAGSSPPRSLPPPLSLRPPTLAGLPHLRVSAQLLSHLSVAHELTSERTDGRTDVLYGRTAGRLGGSAGVWQPTHVRYPISDI